MALDFEYVGIDKDEETSAILGHAGFIKTVEDLYEAMVNAVPGIKFGISFAEASGPCLVRSDGNDPQLIRQAEESMMRIAAGHTFLILFKNAHPINVINDIKNVNEVVKIYCATGNPIQIIVAKAEKGRAIMGVMDGFSSRGIENAEDKETRKKLLRDLGYKR